MSTHGSPSDSKSQEMHGMCYPSSFSLSPHRRRYRYLRWLLKRSFKLEGRMPFTNRNVIDKCRFGRIVETAGRSLAVWVLADSCWNVNTIIIDFYQPSFNSAVSMWGYSLLLDLISSPFVAYTTAYVLAGPIAFVVSFDRCLRHLRKKNIVGTAWFLGAAFLAVQVKTLIL